MYAADEDCLRWNDPLFAAVLNILYSHAPGKRYSGRLHAEAHWRAPLMPNGTQFSGIVTSIASSTTGTTIEVARSPGPGIGASTLAYDNPGYSSIYTLLMASAVNQKLITLYVESITVDVVGGGTAIVGNSVQWVQMAF
jgi:hypothetical protein